MAKERMVDISLGNALPLGSRIRLRRHARGLRLSAMARELGYDRGYLSRVETNQATPSDELVDKIARYFGLSTRDLRDAPLTDLVPPKDEALDSPPPIRRLVLPALPVRPPTQKRSVGQRIERLIAAAHLSQAEEELVADHLAAVTREVLALVRAGRRREDELPRPEPKELADG